MASNVLHSSDKSLSVIVGTKVSRAQAAALKQTARNGNLTVSALVRAILIEWMHSSKTLEEKR